VKDGDDGSGAGWRVSRARDGDDGSGCWSASKHMARASDGDEVAVDDVAD